MLLSCWLYLHCGHVEPASKPLNTALRYTYVNKEKQQGNKGKHLTKEERFCIDKLKKAGFSNKEIARVIGRGESTVSEEIRNNGGVDEYHYEQAHHRAYIRQYRKKRECLKVVMNRGICKNVEYYLYTYKWSPEVISAILRIKHKLLVSAKAIRKYIHRRCLDYLLPYYLKKRKGYPRSTLTDRIFIDDSRCKREGYGHWEGDFIVSSHNTSVLLVLTERMSKKTKIAKLSNRKNDQVNKVITALLHNYTVTSLTLDNDVAFKKHTELSRMINSPIYFTRPYRSSDKALVENTNRWIRQFVPKGSDIQRVTKIQIKKALHWLNERPRECLGWMSASIVARDLEILYAN